MTRSRTTTPAGQARVETFPLRSLPRRVREQLSTGRYLVRRDRVLHVVDIGTDTFDAVVL